MRVSQLEDLKNDLRRYGFTWKDINKERGIIDIFAPNGKKVLHIVAWTHDFITYKGSGTRLNVGSLNGVSFDGNLFLLDDVIAIAIDW